MSAKLTSRIGYVLAGKYELVSVIGQGGMSIVYLAHDNTLNKVWAVKEFKRTGVLKNDKHNKEALIREAELMKSLDHPALPRIVDIIDAEGTVFIVMDYIDGEDLGKIVRTRKLLLTEQETVDLGLQLCSVLDYLHTPDERRGKPVIVYRDMKPDNIILSEDGRVHLLDFGIARKFDEVKTKDTIVTGTPGFWSPEQMSKSMQTDPRSDIYSLGVTLHFLLTGKDPDENSFNVQPIRDYNPRLSPGLDKVIQSCVQNDRDLRYQNCRELAYDLEHYEDLTDEHKSQQKKKLRIFTELAVAAAVFLVVGVLGFVASAAEKNSTYEARISEASKIVLDDDSGSADADYQQKEAAYLAAIDTDDTRTDAYVGLLDMYEIDQQLENAESTSFYDVMTNHAVNCADSEMYARLAYDFASDLFSMKSDYRLAQTWFEKAIEAGTLTETYNSSASSYVSACAFAERLDSSSATSGEQVDSSIDDSDFASYWDGLCECIDAMDSTATTEICQWKLCKLAVDACSATSFVREFRAAGIEEYELTSCVQQVKEYAQGKVGQDSLSDEWSAIVTKCDGGLTQAQEKASEQAATGSAIYVITLIFNGTIDNAKESETATASAALGDVQ